ncbi:MAG: hypothetical protein E6I52_11935 [Chloroflexi bacterium]|nr:MAG: hypothetical protein E6I52_11935 [Chloroflexota bacterium]
MGGYALLQGDQERCLEDRLVAADPQAGVAARQVTQQGLLGLKLARLVEGSAPEWRALGEPLRPRAPGIDPNGTIGYRNQAFGGQTVRRARGAPHRVADDPQARIATPHARVRQSLLQIHWALEAENAHCLASGDLSRDQPHSPPVTGAARPHTGSGGGRLESRAGANSGPHGEFTV